MATIACTLSTTANARAIDDIRISRIGLETSIEIELGCAMRYMDHLHGQSGFEIRVRLTLGYDCRLALQGMRNDLRRPVGNRMDMLTEVEFEHADRDQATLIYRFEVPVVGEIRQTSNLHMLTATVTAAVVTSPQAPPARPPAEPVAEAPTPVPANHDGRITRQVQRPPALRRNRFVIRVAVLDAAENFDYAALDQFRSKTVYTNEVVVGDRRWAELRIGFFDTETEARAVLDKLDADFSSAWITVANSEEQTNAQEQAYDWSSLRSNERAAPPVESVTTTRPVTSLSDEAVAEMMADARAALLRRDFDTSITLYTRLLEEPTGSHRREARELLGVAREKHGQPDHAKAEYQAFLDEFPDGTDSKRIQQRWAALAELPKPGIRASQDSASDDDAEATSRWEYFGGASQHYLRGVNMSPDDDPDFVAQSAVISQAQLVARRRGERFDIETRANVSYLYDFVDSGAVDQGLVSYAYLDIADTKSGISTRLGRQRQQHGGVLGRFDGVHASYRLRPNLSINVTSGFPIDSPRFLPDSGHYFYGASVDVDNIAGAWDLGVFTNQQSVDGILDRQAIGAETQYHGHGLNIVGLLDYDASYNVINTGLISGNWRMNERLSLYGQYRGGAAPFLTTRNAIIGQPVNTVRELFPTYTEGQVRRLARNRTADERFAYAGMSAALTPRLQLKTDFSYIEYSPTVASGGVAAYPGSGPKYTYGGHLLGSGFFKPGHVFIVGYQHEEASSIDGDTVWVDLRLPVGENLRLQSRLAVSQRIADQSLAGNIEQWVANPTFRMSYSWKRKYQIEFEAGGQWSSREFPAALAPPMLPDNTIESSNYYLQLGYNVDF